MALAVTAFSMPAAVVHAVQIDLSTLENLYESFENNPDSQYVQSRIQTESDRIRNVIERELLTIVTPPDETTELSVASDFTRALERQRNVISLLEERLQERRVDLDLLMTEERTVYGSGGLRDDEGDDGMATTESYAELLAKKQELSIRIDVLNSLLARQQERLQKLQMQQRERQISSVLSVGWYVLAIMLVWLAESTMRMRVLAKIKNRDKRYAISKTFTAVVYTALILWLIGMLMSSYPGVLASLAIVGAGIAIALQDIVKDFFGWGMIIKQRMYVLGNRITIGDITGDVIDVSLLRTTVLEVGLKGQTGIDALERTGKVLTFPNALVLSSKLTNHSATSDYVRSEILITITFESNWEKAEAILTEVTDEITLLYADNDEKQLKKREKKFFLPQRVKGNQVHMEIAEDGVMFTLRFTVPIGERRPVVTKLSKEILKRFAKEKDISLAYKTIRYYAK